MGNSPQNDNKIAPSRRVTTEQEQDTALPERIQLAQAEETKTPDVPAPGATTTETNPQLDEMMNRDWSKFGGEVADSWRERAANMSTGNLPTLPEGMGQLGETLENLPRPDISEALVPVKEEFEERIAPVLTAVENGNVPEIPSELQLRAMGISKGEIAAMEAETGVDIPEGEPLSKEEKRALRRQARQAARDANRTPEE